MTYKIQIISDENRYFNLDFENTELSIINSFSDLEAYDYTLIDLNHYKLWNYNKEQYKFEEDINIKTLTNSIKDNDKIIIILPSNKEYTITEILSSEKHQIKNDTTIITKFLSEYFSITQITLDYGKNVTEIRDKEIKSDFHFKNISNFKILTKNNTNKPTTIKRKNIVLTTLQLSYGEDIKNFINQIFCQTTEDIPEWCDKIEMFDDEEQKSLIEHKKQEIQTLEGEIKVAKNKLEENNYYKSILYKQSKPLEITVRTILQDMLKKDLSEFNDIGNEDFLIELQDITFIGEIKGVSRNLTNEHLGELNLNYEKRKDMHKNENLKQLLIINTFRKYPPEKRKPIEKDQIELAENKYGTLIITTENLLKIYVKFKNDEITTEEIKNRFKDEIGVFKP